MLGGGNPRPRRVYVSLAPTERGGQAENRGMKGREGEMEKRTACGIQHGGWIDARHELVSVTRANDDHSQTHTQGTGVVNDLFASFLF